MRTPAVAHGFLDVRGLRLHRLEFEGVGRPVLLVHGVGGTAWIWHRVAPTLATVGRPVAVDLRGFGLSQRSADRSYATTEHADDLEAVLDALDWDDVDVVGFSWGALVAIALAARTRRVRRLALVDMPPSSPLSETEVSPLPYRAVSHAEAVAGERRLAPRATDEVAALTAALLTVPDLEGGLTRAIDPLFLERWPFRSDDRWPELCALEIPVLVVRAEESPALPAEVAAEMAARTGDGRLVTIASCGHLVPVERPAELAAALTGFLGAGAP